MLAALVALFGAGLASFAAPCVLPLVPVYLGMVSGEVAGGAPQRALRATAVFVAGFTAVFVAVGSAAGAVGPVLGDERGPVARLGGVLLVAFGLVMAGVGGRRLQGSARLRLALPAGAVARPLVLGVVFGIAWTPCVGPLLGAALVAAAGTGDPWRGAAALGAYAAGLGTPFLVASAGLAWTPAVHRTLRRVSPVLGRAAAVFLVALGIVVASGHLGEVVALRP